MQGSLGRPDALLRAATRTRWSRTCGPSTRSATRGRLRRRDRRLHRGRHPLAAGRAESGHSPHNVAERTARKHNASLPQRARSYERIEVLRQLVGHGTATLTTADARSARIAHVRRVLGPGQGRRRSTAGHRSPLAHAHAAGCEGVAPRNATGGSVLMQSRTKSRAPAPRARSVAALAIVPWLGAAAASASSASTELQLLDAPRWCRRRRRVQPAGPSQLLAVRRGVGGADRGQRPRGLDSRCRRRRRHSRHPVRAEQRAVRSDFACPPGSAIVAGSSTAFQVGLTDHGIGASDPVFYAIRVVQGSSVAVSNGVPGAPDRARPRRPPRPRGRRRPRPRRRRGNTSTSPSPSPSNTSTSPSPSPSNTSTSPSPSPSNTSTSPSPSPSDSSTSASPSGSTSVLAKS